MNRLSKETSPYLLQHAHNPVDWYPWGDEAFTRAKGEDKPVFLSIGYSACHWCHVMERESFENEEVAELLNREFVSIKVDREERPDVDSIYMQAVQLMTGHGGWPMSMFLTPDGRPFYGGTYFPPDDARGMPGFKRVLRHVADAYREKREQVNQATEEIVAAIAAPMQVPGSAPPISREALHETAGKAAANHDPVHGGFGGAPKFPPSMTLEFLAQVALRTDDAAIREAVVHTLRKMARGGIYDQIGGGFHRYSVDAKWLVPHFEKMLYDNALLARIYVRAWQWTKDPLFSRVANETVAFILREMTSPDGGFYSTLDADSEGVEGKFYVWSRQEIFEILGADRGRFFCALYDVTEQGNWEGTNILHVPRDFTAVADDLALSADRLLEIARDGKRQLYAARERRVRPGRDEKILAGWNGWMLAALSEAALAFPRTEHRNAVRKNADFLVGTMLDGDRLYRSCKEGRCRINGLLEDYAGVAWGLIGAFEALQDARYLETARRLARQIMERFRDRENGGFFDTPDDHEKLIARPKDLFDNATPSGNSLAIDVLNKLAVLYADEEMQRTAREALEATWPVAQRYPTGFGYLLAAAEWSAGQPKEIVITGDAPELWRVVGEEYVPHRVLVSPAAKDLPLLEGRPPEVAMAYVCRSYQCLAPTDEPESFRQQLLL
jgi:uncharacterized protein